MVRQYTDLMTQPDSPQLQRLLPADIARALPPRQRESHKGSYGSVLVIGGGQGMPGAVRLAGESALRVGAGRVTVASLPQHLTAVVGARPELMFINADDPKALAAALAQADVVAIGPGLGTDAWAQSLLQAVLSQSQPAQQWVLDADALNLLAAMPAPVARDNWILTPHPGEAARLLGITTAAVQADRLAAVGALQQRWGGVVVLKGAGTLIGAAGQVTSLCDRGNPGMAIPGMGDVLTGAVAGILAQCGQPLLAAKAAVLAQAMAGDLCATDGERGLLAGDIARALHAVVNP